MAINVEIWQDYIAENLFENNEFINLAINADGNVNGKTVHIPSAGSAATVTRNLTNFPATVTERTDADATYSIDEFYIAPVRVPQADLYELSYDKMNSLMLDVMGNMQDTVGNWMLYNWRATADAYIARTTGADVEAHVSSAVTGNRKKFIAADLQAASRILTHAKAPMGERYCLLDAYMYDQLLSDLKFGEFRETIKEADLARGIIGNLFGFKILLRPTVLTYDNTGTPVAREPGYTAAATDNGAALCWSKWAVERALGDVKVFENIQDPTYYGDIISGYVRSGGRKRRNDGVGVVAIVQAAA